MEKRINNGVNEHTIKVLLGILTTEVGKRIFFAIAFVVATTVLLADLLSVIFLEKDASLRLSIVFFVSLALSLEVTYFSIKYMFYKFNSLKVFNFKSVGAAHLFPLACFMTMHSLLLLNDTGSYEPMSVKALLIGFLTVLGVEFVFLLCTAKNMSEMFNFDFVSVFKKLVSQSIAEKYCMLRILLFTLTICAVSSFSLGTFIVMFAFSLWHWGVAANYALKFAAERRSIQA
ncbi:hypothetical protein KJI95_11120 [Shewanella sp. JM162201]|uniref:Uncharacterized protein n=1 Tax=Shewanella jiangmenensis TaxID=2837387 RepID=A0ABS5V5F4_9GAMM|nr:hypothetical protein [Shewanella jiangmenensis]MBT1445070.1 hypothetical protein [Shewanella jiangmenensis]